MKLATVKTLLLSTALATGTALLWLRQNPPTSGQPAPPASANQETVAVRGAQKPDPQAAAGPRRFNWRNPFSKPQAETAK